jgi:hypothetical protein
MPVIKLTEVHYTRAQHYAAVTGCEPTDIERAALDECDRVTERLITGLEQWRSELSEREKRMLGVS